MVEPDLLFVSEARRHEILTKQNVKGVPDLVVEVGSPGTRKRDEILKRRLYEVQGVLEYWIVDPDLQTVRVFRRERERYGRPIELSREAGDVLTTSVFPGLELPLARIFKT